MSVHPQYTVELAGVDEAVAIHNLIAVAGARAYANWGEQTFAEWLQSMYSPEKIEERLRNPDIETYRIGSKETPLATANLTMDGDVAVLGGLYCRNERVGLGTVLLQHRLDRARDLGAKLARAIPIAPNKPAISFLHKHGFHIERQVRAGNRYGEDDPYAHLMVVDMELKL